MRKALRKIAHKCHFRRTPCCANCRFYDDGEWDNGLYSTYSPFCGNEKNEDPETLGGQHFTFGVTYDTVCDLHEFKK